MLEEEYKLVLEELNGDELTVVMVVVGFEDTGVKKVVSVVEKVLFDVDDDDDDGCVAVVEVVTDAIAVDVITVVVMGKVNIGVVVVVVGSGIHMNSNSRYLSVPSHGSYENVLVALTSNKQNEEF